jgi:hypothetical protein
MDFDPYEKWLGIALERRPPSGHDLLGLPKEGIDKAQVNEAWQERLNRVRVYSSSPNREIAEAAQNLEEELTQARIALTEALERGEPQQTPTSCSLPVPATAEARAASPNAPTTVHTDSAMAENRSTEEAAEQPAAVVRTTGDVQRAVTLQVPLWVWVATGNLGSKLSTGTCLYWDQPSYRRPGLSLTCIGE